MDFCNQNDMIIDEDLNNKNLKLNNIVKKYHEYQEACSSSKRMKYENYQEVKEETDDEYNISNDGFDSQSINDEKNPQILISPFGGSYYLIDENMSSQRSQSMEHSPSTDTNLLSTDTNETENYQEIAYRYLKNSLIEDVICSSPKTGDHFLVKSLEVIDLRENVSFSDNLEKLLIDKPINKIFKYSFDKLNLQHKDILIFLIERNFSYKLISPFDYYAYCKLKPKQELTNRIISQQSIHDFNYYNIRKIAKLLRTLHPQDRNFLRQNNLMPSCLSNLLMPFFFDIFSISELKQYGCESVNIMLSLKQAYKAQVYLNELTLTSCLDVNVIWNCLALFKLKLNSQHADEDTVRMGFLNFYLSYLYIQIHMGMTAQNSNDLKHSNELASVLNRFLDALILTGYFKHTDYVKFKKFHDEKKKPVQSIEQAYYENSIKNVSLTADICFPLRLKNLCRIQIKKSLINYNIETLDRLDIPSATKKFLMYTDELDLIYNQRS